MSVPNFDQQVLYGPMASVIQVVYVMTHESDSAQHRMIKLLAATHVSPYVTMLMISLSTKLDAKALFLHAPCVLTPEQL